jgi:hypothetical protein
LAALTAFGRSFEPADLRGLDQGAALALRWYVLSRDIERNDDRYLALWVALEALAGGPGTDLLKRTSSLVLAAAGPEAESAVRAAFDIRQLRELRNRLVAGTARELAPSNVKFTVSGRTVAALEALVADTLRARLRLPAEREFVKALGGS